MSAPTTPTPREVVVLALQDISGVCPDYDDGEDADAILAALSAAGFAVVPAAVKNQIDRLPTGAPTNQIEALAWIAAAMEAKSAMLAAAEGKAR